MAYSPQHILHNPLNRTLPEDQLLDKDHSKDSLLVRLPFEITSSPRDDLEIILT